MSFTIPVINLEFNDVKEIVWTKIQEPKNQRRLILVIVSIALLLDNMLYMVIVPIIPDYLRYLAVLNGEMEEIPDNGTNTGGPRHRDHHGQDSATGILFASKAIVQLMVNPFSGAIIDRIGYDIPMMVGLTIMFFSTAIFACGRSYSVLFFARSLQGAGSAFADTAGLAMIADRFTEENERSRALGIALAFISFGCLVAPPFGGALYQFAGKEMPFLILAFVCLLDGLMLLLVMKPFKEQLAERQEVRAPSIPIWKLMMDPYIAVCAGALMMSNVALAFLEPTISLWMEDNMTTENWKIGMIWLPAFFPHVFGVVITVKMARRYPHHQWLMAAVGLALEGFSCFIIPFCSTYKMLMIPICVICFGIALIDTALLPTLGYLVDVRYVSVYGSIYAIADISYSLAYAVGPIIAGGIVETIGFTALNFIIAFSNLLYAPMLKYLKNIYDFKPFESEANILMGDPPTKEYQTYTMHDQRPIDGEYKNHLDYTARYDDNGEQLRLQETNIDQEMQQGGYQPGYQEQGGVYQQQQQQSSTRHLPQQPVAANPFRQAETQQQQQQQQAQAPSSRPVSNPFRQGMHHSPEDIGGDPLSVPGDESTTKVNDTYQSPMARLIIYQRWKDSLLSLPKKWLSQTGAVDDFGFPLDLPKVPVPDLDQTMTEYVRIMEPILTPQQHNRLKEIVKQFSSPSGLGPVLQEYLQEKRERDVNWAYDYWLNDMYMDVRLALPINSNPGMVFPPRKFTTVHDVARFSARIIDGIMMHKETLESGQLTQERAASREKNQPLCMAQYHRLLGSCRRPGDPRDSQYLPETKEDHHVIVTCRNQMYCIPVRADDRGRLSEDELASQFLYILSDAPCLPYTAPQLGVLTAASRTPWAHDRQKLLKDYQNSRNIELIEQALIVLCLDEPLSSKFNVRTSMGGNSGHQAGDRDETNMEHQMIHGGGSEFNSGNRWFDKTMQIIISTDGVWGLCYEHSTSEGIAVVQLLENIVNRIDEMGQVEEGTHQMHLPPPERLEWNIQPELQLRLKEAATDFDRRIEDLDFYVYRYKSYGKSFIKSCQVSPDCYIQLALQLAYYKLYGFIVSTYESAGTRRFASGRVDCIRSATTEALEWAKAMCQGAGPNVPLESGGEEEEESAEENKKNDHLRELFRCAAARQTEIMVQNIMGQGIDIHLLGLREACNDRGGALHELFSDETYAIANCFLLSTSQVTCSTDSFMGYGPVTPKGYGCSYNPYPEEIVFCVSAFYSCEDTSATRYAKSLQESLDLMRKLLET